MNIFSTLSFISAFTFLILMGIIIKSKVEKKSRLFMLIINFSLFLWTFGWSFIYFAKDTETAQFWYRISSIGWMFTFSPLLHFSLLLTRTVKTIPERILIHCIHIPSLIFLYMSFSTDEFMLKGFVINGPYSSMNILDYESYWFIAFMIWMQTYAIATVILLYRWGKKSKKNSTRKQAYTMILAIMAPLFFGVFSNIILRRILNDFPPTDAITNIFFALLLWHAISKYQFMKLTTDSILEEIITSMSDFLILTDTRLNVVKVNRRTMESVCRHENVDENDRPITKIILEKKIIRKQVKKSAAFGEKTIDSEVHLIKNNGELLSVKMAVTKILDKFNDHVGYLFFAHDITEQIELEQKNKQLNASREELKNEVLAKTRILEKLSIAEKKLKNLGDNLPGGAIFQGYVSDNQFIFNYISKNIKDITGIEGVEIIKDPQSIYCRFHPDDLERVLKEQKKALTNRTLLDTECRLLNAKEKYIWIRIRTYPRIEDNQEFWDGILFDINDKKIAEENYLRLNTELEDRINQRTDELKVAKDQLAVFLEQEKELNEMKTRFINLVFHEFKTPLTVVFSSSEIVKLLLGQKDYDTIDKQIEKILLSVKNMDKLLNYVQRFQTSSEMLKKYNPVTFNIEEAMAKSVDILKKMEKKNCPINIDISLTNREISTDSNMFEQIMFELLANAMKFSEEGSPININIEERNNKLNIQISDKGTGIAEADLKNIFQPFYKAKEKIGLDSGLGLGLSIVQKYTKMMQGDIEVESAPQKGTIFKLTLPKKAG